jgi:hypothetical protein
LRFTYSLTFICSGVFSTLFLYLVDVDKSRAECEAFVRAEQERKAFEPSAHFASAYTGDEEVRMDSEA